MGKPKSVFNSRSQARVESIRNKSSTITPSVPQAHAASINADVSTGGSFESPIDRIGRFVTNVGRGSIDTGKSYTTDFYDMAEATVTGREREDKSYQDETLIGAFGRGLFEGNLQGAVDEAGRRITHEPGRVVGEIATETAIMLGTMGAGAALKGARIGATGVKAGQQFIKTKSTAGVSKTKTGKNKVLGSKSVSGYERNTSRFSPFNRGGKEFISGDFKKGHTLTIKTNKQGKETAKLTKDLSITGWTRGITSRSTNIGNRFAQRAGRTQKVSLPVVAGGSKSGTRVDNLPKITEVTVQKGKIIDTPGLVIKTKTLGFTKQPVVTREQEEAILNILYKKVDKSDLILREAENISPSHVLGAQHGVYQKAGIIDLTDTSVKMTTPTLTQPLDKYTVKTAIEGAVLNAIGKGESKEMAMKEGLEVLNTYKLFGGIHQASVKRINETQILTPYQIGMLRADVKAGKLTEKAYNTTMKKQRKILNDIDKAKLGTDTDIYWVKDAYGKNIQERNITFDKNNRRIFGNKGISNRNQLSIGTLQSWINEGVAPRNIKTGEIPHPSWDLNPHQYKMDKITRGEEGVLRQMHQNLLYKENISEINLINIKKGSATGKKFDESGADLAAGANETWESFMEKNPSGLKPLLDYIPSETDKSFHKVAAKKIKEKFGIEISPDIEKHAKNLGMTNTEFRNISFQNMKKFSNDIELKNYGLGKENKTNTTIKKKTKPFEYVERVDRIDSKKKPVNPQVPEPLSIDGIYLAMKAGIFKKNAFPKERPWEKAEIIKNPDFDWTKIAVTNVRNRYKTQSLPKGFTYDLPITRARKLTKNEINQRKRHTSSLEYDIDKGIVDSDYFGSNILPYGVTIAKLKKLNLESKLRRKLNSKPTFKRNTKDTKRINIKHAKPIWEI